MERDSDIPFAAVQRIGQRSVQNKRSDAGCASCRGGTNYIERVDVSGNKTFINFVEQLGRGGTLKHQDRRQSSHSDNSARSAEAAQRYRDPKSSPIPTRKKSLAEEN